MIEATSATRSTLLRHNATQCDWSAEVWAWIPVLENEGLAPGMMKGVYRAFSKILKTSVIDGLFPPSPCIWIDLPKQTFHEEMRFLTPEQVEALAEALEPRLTALIYTTAYPAMRWGEL